VRTVERDHYEFREQGIESRVTKSHVALASTLQERIQPFVPRLDMVYLILMGKLQSLQFSLAVSLVFTALVCSVNEWNHRTFVFRVLMVCMSELYGLRVANGGHLLPDIRVHQKSSVRAKPASINLKLQDKH
jgi:hypothetical protein